MLSHTNHTHFVLGVQQRVDAAAILRRPNRDTRPSALLHNVPQAVLELHPDAVHVRLAREHWGRRPRGAGLSLGDLGGEATEERRAEHHACLRLSRHLHTHAARVGQQLRKNAVTRLAATREVDGINDVALGVHLLHNVASLE